MNLATVETAKGARMFRNPVERERAVINLVITPVKAAVRNPVRAASCSSCCLQGVCLPCGQNSEKLEDMDELTRVKRKVARGATLYRSGDAFDSLYAVRSGSFKSVGLSRGGEEKVTGLHLRGRSAGSGGDQQPPAWLRCGRARGQRSVRDPVRAIDSARDAHPRAPGTAPAGC